MESIVKSARVKDIILDENHIKYIDVKDIGKIYYKEITKTEYNAPIAESKIHTLATAKPLFSFVKNYPLKEEIVLIIESQGAEDPTDTADYYLPVLNIKGQPHVNPFPFHRLKSGYSKIDNYREAESGLSQKNLKTDADSLNLGNYFEEKDSIRPLRPFEGDIIIEGRFGNSLRFGSTIDKSKIFRDTNKWSNEGEIGDPITIIRNGQGTSGKNGWVHTLEDANLDDSSIYLTSNQQITGFTPASIHWKSWGANLEKPKTILNPVLDKQVEPEVVEQSLPEEEEPVTTSPEVPPIDEVEEEVNEKTFEDSSNISEDNTDLNNIKFSDSIILNKGTLRYKWIFENKDPQPEEFLEITGGLDQMIGNNFTLKHLIFSKTATNPEFGIHEDAELERVGIYFHSTGTSATGVVEGYYVKDILGFYFEGGGFNNFIEIKDSNMTTIHKTQSSFSDVQTQLELAETAIFSAGSPYYDYNMPNPGINNYPGIDDGLISGDEVVSNLKKVVENCIDKIIEQFPSLEITSAYRSMEVNNSVITTSNNEHAKGIAIDFRVPGTNTSEVFNWCFENLEEWKDLMWAYPEREVDSWIHISYEEEKNEKHTTLASEIDSIHEYYESDRRGSLRQYQDGILKANQELI